MDCGFFQLLFKGDRGNQLVASPRNVTNELRVPGIVTQCLAQLPDGVGQDLVSDEGVGPDGLDETLFGDDLAPMVRRISGRFLPNRLE